MNDETNQDTLEVFTDQVQRLSLEELQALLTVLRREGPSRHEETTIVARRLDAIETGNEGQVESARQRG